MNNKKCQLCQHYGKDGYCEELEFFPCYPEKGCDFFSERFDLTPCDNAVSRQAAIEAFQMFREYESNRSNKEWVNRIETVLNQLPPVNPQPKTGRWRKVSMDKYIRHATYYYECSECGNQHIGHANYCPNCGAKMQEVKDES